MAFLDDFREAAIPKLRECARVQAFFVALELIDVDEAQVQIRACARTAGASLLPPREQDRLDAWIVDTLWAEMDKAHDRVVVLQQQAEIAEKADPVRYYDGLAARCVNAEAMRWAFAAISPVYRKHLNGERHVGG